VTERPAIAPSAPAGPGDKPRWTAYLWRGLALAVIVAGFLMLARRLGRPGGAMPGAAGGPEADFFPPPLDRPKPPGGDQARTAADSQDPLRRLLAGVLMAAAEEEGHYEHPENQTPAGRRRAIADALGVPGFRPADQAPAEMVPPQAQVLAVFEQPHGEGGRMVLVRFKKTVGQALADFDGHYKAADGWQRQGDRPVPAAKDADGRRGPDRGWLVTWRRGPVWRFVFAQPRADKDEETLAVVYDSR
jgi:hypothetical protein